MTEPGLRKIPKVSIYSTTTSSEMTSTNPPSNEEHIYCSIQEDLHVATTDADNVYETVDVPDDSGFFSYISTTSSARRDSAREESARRESGLATAASSSSYMGQSQISAPQAVTCIPINQCPSSTSSEYDEKSSTPSSSMLCTRVTVNGKLWLNPCHTTTNSANPSSDIQNTNSVLLNTKRQI